MSGDDEEYEGDVFDGDPDAIDFPPIDDGDGPPPAALDGLNGPQADAVANVYGPLVVFAGAGSGKTRVITYRIANLLANHRVPPYRVLAVTFTNKAAGEMRARLDKLVGAELARDLWVGTFHATCAKLLRRYHEAAGLGREFVIYDDDDQRALVNRILRDFGIDDKRFGVKQVLGRIHKEKQEGVTAADFTPGNYADEIVGRCFREYEARMQRSNAVDFDDLLLHVVRIAEDPASPAGAELRGRFRHVLVDEFQDVNRVQYRLVRALSQEHENLCVVGDDDQSIYRWRGADVRILRSFRRDHPSAKIVKLEQNYRSSKNVVRAALGVIARAHEREPKELWTSNAPGEKVAVVAAASERDEAAFVAERVHELIEQGVSPAEIAVFYRMHAQSRVLEEVFRQERLPHQILGGLRFFERAEVKDLVAYLRVVVNPRSDVDVLRIINVPSRKLGEATIEKLAAVADRERCSLLEAIEPLAASGAVTAAPKKALLGFASLIARLSARAATAPPSELAADILEETGYRKALELDDSVEAEARLQNLEELVGSIAEYEAEIAAAGELPTVGGWLERVSLASVTDDLKDAPKVALMTVHAAKGLEFDSVFITGVEEDTFPFKSQDPTRKNDPEEERRLAYVAITRARRRLWMLHAERRSLFGTMRFCAPSRFLADMPEEVVAKAKTSTLRSGEGRSIDAPGWGGGWSGGARADAPSARPRLAWSASTPATRTPSSPAAGRANSPSHEAGERYVEREDDGGEASSLGRRAMERAVAAQGAGLRAGQRVAHKTFGVGVVLDVDDDADPTATIRFSGWSPKRIKVRFLTAVD